MTAPRIYLNGATLMTTPTDRLLGVARRAGFAGIEPRIERLLADSGEVRAATAEVLPGEVLALNGVSLSLRPDGRLDRATLEADLAPRIQICTELQAAYLLAVAPRAPGMRATDAIPALREGLDLVADRSQASGIRVAFEFLGFPDCPVNTPALAGQLVERVHEVEMVIDSCHWHGSGAGPLRDYPVDRLALVHLNDAPPKPESEIEDADRLLPGDGVIALSSFVADLRSRGYTGPWSLETFNPNFWVDAPDDVARRGLAAMETVLR